MKKKRSRNSVIRSEIRRALQGEFASVLHDIDYRIKVARDTVNGGGRLGAADLNLAVHQIDGYTVSDNSPSAGKITWTGLHIVYKGTDYTITDNTTGSALKYHYWQLATPNALISSDTKPVPGTTPGANVLTEDDVLVFINEGGKHVTAMNSGKMISGLNLTATSISSAELGNGSVTEDKIGALAVSSGKIASGAVTDGKLGANCVNAGNVKAGAIAASKLNTAQHMVY